MAYQFSIALTGTITFTNGNTAVTGSGSAFLSEVIVGSLVKLNADSASAWGKVQSIASNTSLTLASNYTGTGGAGASSVSTLNITPATCSAAAFFLKRLLKVQGWTVPVSSDGTTYNASGDQITSPLSGSNGMDNASAWFVIVHPDTKHSFCLQRNSATGVNTSYMWKVLYNYQSGTWSGGTATNPPVPGVASLTGTVTMANSSTAVTGSGTLFTSELVVGQYIKCDADSGLNMWGRVASIASDTSLTLGWGYQGASHSGVAGSKSTMQWVTGQYNAFQSLFGVSTDGGLRFHCFADSASSYGFASFAWQNSVLYPCHIFGLDPLQACCAADPDPYMVHCQGQLSTSVYSAQNCPCHSLTIADPVATYYQRQAHGYYSYYSGGVQTKWAGTTGYTATTDEIIGSTLGPYYGGNNYVGYWVAFGGLNADNKDDALPIFFTGSAGTYSSANQYRKGYSSLMQAVGQGSRSTGSRYSLSATYDSIVFGQCVLPWDQASAVTP